MADEIIYVVKRVEAFSGMLDKGPVLKIQLGDQRARREIPDLTISICVQAGRGGAILDLLTSPRSFQPQ